MKKLLLLSTLLLLLASCGSSKKTATSKRASTSSTKVSHNSTSKKTEAIISYAKTFQGTKYKFGGTSKKGMDCSGLIYTSFKSENIYLPRISREIATKGNKISLSNAHNGDLVFFKTDKNKKTINHVGLIIEKKKGELIFIHSTTSKGVIITSLEEKYWKSSFVEARRIL